MSSALANGLLTSASLNAPVMYCSHVRGITYEVNDATKKIETSCMNQSLI